MSRTQFDNYHYYQSRTDEIIDVEVTKETPVTANQETLNKYASFDFGATQRSESAQSQSQKSQQRQEDPKVKALVMNVFENLPKQKSVDLQLSPEELQRTFLQRSEHHRETSLAWNRL